MKLGAGEGYERGGAVGGACKGGAVGGACGRYVQMRRKMCGEWQSGVGWGGDWND